MFEDPKFRASTWKADALQIWGGLLFMLVTGTTALLEGLGVAISLLIAVGALPLAILTIMLLQHRKEILAAIRRWFESARGEQAGLLEAGLSTEKYKYDPAEDAPTKDAYFDLLGFAGNYLMPACDRQINLQKKIIEQLCENGEIAKFAIDGLQLSRRSETQIFWTHYDYIFRGIYTSEPVLKWSALIEAIKKLERGGYKAFCAQADTIANASGFNYKSNKGTSPIWEEWRNLHNILVNEYEKIKKDARFGDRIFFPSRETEWGKEVPPL